MMPPPGLVIEYEVNGCVMNNYDISHFKTVKQGNIRVPLLLLIGLFNMSFICFSQNDPNDSTIVTIGNDQIEVSVCIRTGGRLVFFGAPGGENMLKVNEEVWNRQSLMPEEPSPFDDFTAYDGMIVWLAPQSQWWTHQTLNEKRKEEQSIWPPDPYIIYGRNRVTCHTSDSIIVEGPCSPVSGVRVNKIFSLQGNGLTIKTELVNCSEQDVSWGIWTNSRFCFNTSFFVPGVDEESLWFQYDESGEKKQVDHLVENGNFTFLMPEEEERKADGFVTKAFMHPNSGHLVAFQEHNMLIMEFDVEDSDKLPPGHGLVEVYLATSPDGSDNILELEHHSEYRELVPGETFSTEQTWFLYPFSGKTSLGNFRKAYHAVGKGELQS